MITHALGYQTKLPPKAIRETDLYAELKLTEIFNRPSTIGIWYDPQDLTTLFQGAKGTLPVYRPGTGLVDPPVGLMLDKGQGLELGPELVTNGDFSGGATGWTLESGWSIANGTASATAATGALYRGGIFSGKYYEVTYTILNYVSGSVKLLTGTSSSPTVRSANGTYTERLFCLGTPQTRVQPVTPFTGSIDNISVREIKGYHAYQTTTTARPTLSGRYNLLTATETLSTQSVTTVATNYTLKFEGAGTITLSGTATGTYSAGKHTIPCTAGTLTCTVAGTVARADLRAANDGVGLPPYQRVDSATTYDTAGFPLYLKFDGVDDFLQTAKVDLTGTDEVTVGCGLWREKLLTNVIVESSLVTDSYHGSFALFGRVLDGDIAYRATGSLLSHAGAYSDQIVTPPCTNTVALRVKLSTGAELLVNGNTVMSDSALRGGMFGSHELFIGSRGGLNFYTRSHIYQLCIIGSLLSTSEQAVLERYLNAKTRAY